VVLTGVWSDTAENQLIGKAGEIVVRCEHWTVEAKDAEASHITVALIANRDNAGLLELWALVAIPTLLTRPKVACCVDKRIEGRGRNRQWLAGLHLLKRIARHGLRSNAKAGEIGVRIHLFDVNGERLFDE